MEIRRLLSLAAFLSITSPLFAAAPTWNAPLTKTDRSVTASWDANGNVAGTRYSLDVSTRNDFEAGTVISSNTALLTATINELQGNHHYFVRLQALDPVSPYADPIREVTTLASPALPQLTGDVFVPDPTGITVRWFSNENAEGTIYRVEAFADETFTQQAGSGDTTGTSLRMGSLSSNKRYWFTVKAANIAEAGYAATLVVGSAYTLPGSYSLTSTPIASPTIWYGQDKSAITFMTDGFSSGNVAYFRYRWMPNSVYAWPADDQQEPAGEKWEPAQGNLVQSNEITGQYYLHIKAYNAAGKSNGTTSEKVSDLFKIDVMPPLPSPAILRNATLNGNSITWNAEVGTDDSGINVRYGWSLNGAPEMFNVSNASVTAALLPNTTYTMTLRTRDNADGPNLTEAAALTKVTLQKLPTSIQVLGVTETSVRVQINANGDFPNLLLGDSGLQVQATDSQDTFVSNWEKTNVILLEGLNPNTIYNVRGCSRNQAGDETGCTSAVPARTLGGSSAVTADAIPYNPPNPGGKYAGGKTILFTDNGAYANHLVAYYTMVLDGDPNKPSAIRQKQQGLRFNTGSWSWTFNETQEVFAHIQSYAGDNSAIAGGYSLLGPWIIDASPPLDKGGSTVTVTGVSQMIFKAGDVVDEGLAGMHAAPYSFDNGATFQSEDTFIVSGIPTNSLFISTIVFRDEVDNRSLPISVTGYTLQNPPTGIQLISINGKQVVLEAQETFPNLNEGLSGIQFGIVQADTIDWKPQWLHEKQVTYDFANFNASYLIVAKARNAAGVETAHSPELVVHTQPRSPAVSPFIGTVVQEWKAGAFFDFKSSTVPGVDTFHHYAYVWTKNETYAFDGSLPELSWAPASTDEILSLSAAESGKWYLHIRSVNNIGEPSNPARLGWFGRDIVAPTDAMLKAPTVGTNSIGWSTEIATDTLVGLHDEPYLWSLDGGSVSSTTISNPAFMSLDLTPNSFHTIVLRVRDRLGNTSTALTTEARTLARGPIAVSSAFDVKKTSAVVSFRDDGNPNGTIFQVEISQHDDFNPLHEAAISVTRNNPVDGIMKAEFGVNGTPLSPNTTYYVRARAFNQDSVPTAHVHLGTFTTRPLSPDVKLEPNGSQYAKGQEFGFQSNIPFGQGTVEYLRWVWLTSPGKYSWSNLDNRLDAANPVVHFSADRAGTYYLHAAAYSGGAMNNNPPETFVSHAITIMAPNGSSLEIISANATSTAIEVVQAPLPNVALYGFQLDEGTTIYQTGSVYAFPNLTPNTRYQVRIYAKDSVDQLLGSYPPPTQYVTTLQSPPIRIDVTNVGATSATLTAVGAFQNVGQSANTAFHFTLRSVYNPIVSWSSSETMQIPAEGLHPNTLYTVTVRTRNSAGSDDNVEAALMSFTTLAMTPTELVIRPVGHNINTYFSLPKKFEFERGQGLSGNWGPGFVEYFRVITSNDVTMPTLADFNDDAKSGIWIADTRYSTEPVTAASYYTHFRSYNSANVGGPVYTYGPVYIDNQPPLPNPPTLDTVQVFVSSVTWTATPATDVGGAGLPSSPYLFHFGASDPAQDFPRVSTYTMRNLSPNTTYSINLAVRDNLGNTTLAQSFSTCTLAAAPIPLLASLQVHISSAEFSWSNELPNNSPKTRYEIGAFLSSDLTANPAAVIDAGVGVSSGAIQRLNLDTIYWFAVRAENAYGHKTAWAGVGNGRTKNEIVAPIITESLTVAVDHVVMNWVDLNPEGTTYEVLSNEGVPLLVGGTPISVGNALFRQFNGLTPNTTYSFGVRAKSQTAIYSSFASVAAVTRAKPPTDGLLTVHRTSATVSWAANGNPDGTAYEVRASTSANLDGIENVNKIIVGTNGQITGLVPDKEYFVSVRAMNHAGMKTDWSALGSGVTGVQPPQPPYLFTSTTTTSFRLSWANGGNTAGLSYEIARSMDNFATDISSITTTELFMEAQSLSYNTTYYLRGKAIGLHSDSPVVPMGFLVTHATHPVAGVLEPALTSMHMTWGANGNPPETAYRYEVANNPVFQTPERRQTVVGTETTVEGLNQNTTYWVRIYAVNHGEISSQFYADNGYAVTLAANPVIPILQSSWTAKWNLTRGNYVVTDISAGDLNPNHTEYSIFNINDNVYLVGDTAGSVSATPVWHTRSEWNTTQIQEGKGIHGNLLPRTQYEYKVRARNHAGVLTDFSDVHPVLTVPAKPNFSASVADNNFVLLNWEPWNQNAADALRVYVSATGTPGSFAQYYDTVDDLSVHSIKPEGKKGVDEIPNSLFETRHDTEGGTPAKMTALEFNQSVDAATDTLHFGWTTVANPSAAPLHFYYIAGLSGFGEEGAPSEVKSAQVQPIVNYYVIAGTRTGSAVDNNYEFLAPTANNVTIPNLESNTHLRVQVKARSSDGIDGDPSPFIDAWTLAHTPGQPTVTSNFNVSHHIYNNVTIDAAGNPAHTQYAIYWVEGDKFMSGGGGAIGASVTDTNTAWLTKKQWDFGFTHSGLQSSKIYTYKVYARNGNETSGPHLVTEASVGGSAQTITFPPPTQLSGVGEMNGAIRWRWYDNATDELRFEIADKQGNDFIFKKRADMSTPQNATGFLEEVELNTALPNSPVTRVVRAVNDAGYSLPSNEATAWTLAVEPDVESTNHQINLVSNEIKFMFKNNLVFGPGTIDHYRVKFTNSPTYTFDGAETLWDNPAEIKEFTRDVIAEMSSWYLHVMSYNHDNTPSPQAKVYGPYNLFQDVVAPGIEEIRQDGAESISGAREPSPLAGLLNANATNLKVKNTLGIPQLDASFASGVPWAPTVQGIHIRFTKRLDGATLTNNSVLVHAIQNNLSQVISPRKMDYVVDYNDAERELNILFTQPGLPAGHLFEVQLTADAKDVAGNAVPTGFRYYFRTFLDPNVTNEVVTMNPSGELNMRLHFPAGSLPEIGSVGVETDPGSFPWGFDNSSRQRANQKQISIGGLFATPLSEKFIGHFNVQHGRTDGKLRAGAILSMPFSDDDNDGYVDSMPGLTPQESSAVKVKVANLSIYRFDEGSQLWVKVPGSHIDPTNKMVVAVTYHMGVFAVIGTAATDVGATYAYPVPYVAARDVAQGIKFVNLPDAGTIKIYTVAGELVKEIQFAPGRPDPLPWDVKNDSGQAVGADVYIYHVTSGGNKKTGKIVIVK